MNGMNIRTATRKDIPVITKFQLEMALETERLELNRETVHLGVSGVFDNPLRGCYYVAESGGNIVGSLLTTYEWSDWRNGTVLWIQSVYVLPDFRRKGIYRALYLHIKNLVMTDASLFGIRLYADVSNSPAHQAYTNLGMNDGHYKTFEWMKQLQ
jgi:GNAT superfamily N-acetyltransferase